MRTSHRSWSLLLVLSLFVWAGMVGAISFLEAPLKFTAPHITVPLGVGIGRVVFHALNKVEVILCALALLSSIYLRVPQRLALGLSVLTAILLLQTFWLLPALDLRAEALLGGHTPPPNSLHVLYIVIEATKLLTLLVTGIGAFFAALGPRPHRRHHPAHAPAPAQLTEA